MEIHYVDIPTSARMATQRLAKISFLPMNWVIASKMTRDWGFEKYVSYHELLRMRKANNAVKLRDAFTRVSRHNASSFVLEQLDNGLVRASNGYYALTEDIETGTINILWSRDQKYLLGQKDENGLSRLSSTDFVYYVGSVPLEYGEPSVKNGTKPIFDNDTIRNIISEDFTKFRAKAAQHMSLHAGDVSDLYESVIIEPTKARGGAPRKSKIYTFTNDDLSYTISDTEDGKWILKKYAPYARLNASEGFTEVNGTNVDHDKLLKYIFSNGFEVGTYDSQTEAFSKLIERWNNEVQESWRGKKPIQMREAPYTIFRTMLYDAVVKELKNKENVEEGFFDSLVETVPILWLGFRILAPTMPVVIMTTVLAGFGMRKGLDGFKWLRKEGMWLLRGAKSVDAIAARSIDGSRDNQNRLRQKLNDNFISRNRLLTMDDLPVNGITQDFQQTISAAEKADWVQRWLVTFNNKGFPTIDFVVDEFSEVNICFNGLVRFESRDPVTRDKVTFTTYIENFDRNENIALPDDIKEMLQDGKIIRVDQLEKDQTFSMRELGEDQFFPEISDILEQHAVTVGKLESYNASLQHICELFGQDNCMETPELTMPQLSRIMPVEQIAQPEP